MKNLLYLLIVVNSFAATRGWQTGETAAREGQRRLSSGLFHTCAALSGGTGTVGGTVKCWGQNGFGELGDGTTTNQPSPVAVQDTNQAPLANIVEVAAGSGFTCALDAGGRVACWGRNNRGQLGDGTTIDHRRAAFIPNLDDVVHVVAGFTWACALQVNGDTRCWGANFSGQLGDGTFLDRSVPGTVLGLPPSIDIAAGGTHMCGLASSGTVRCWGSNQSGQLGNGVSGSTVPSTTPVDVLNLSGATSLAASSLSACATTMSGLFCWGSNESGQLGTGDLLLRSSATFAGVSNVTAVGRGNDHFCTVTAGGLAKCQGNNRFGKLGDGTFTNATQAVTVAGASLVVGITGGTAHTCLLRADGTVGCVGSNEFGQLGNGSATGPNTFSSAVVNVTGIGGGTMAKAIATGAQHSCALRADGTVACWGSDNRAGVLGNGVLASSLQPAPVNVAGLAGVTAITAGDFHTCALRADGTVACWGNNLSAQTGNGNQSLQSTPFLVTAVTNAVGVEAGASHTCAVLASGTVKCWGANASGQIGNGVVTAVQFTPATILVNQVTALAAGRAHTCARLANGTARCWGAGDFGQVGTGVIQATNPIPQAVANLTTVVTIGAGEDFSCALLADGSLQCWGENDRGQLGVPTLGNLPLPQSMTSGAFQLMIAGGQSHSCMVNSGGTMRCAGESLAGRLGNNQLVQSPQSTPVAVQNLDHVMAIATGREHSCAVRATGQAFCWGNAGQHRLGNGSLANRALPTAVTGF